MAEATKDPAFALGPIGPEDNRGWSLTVNGEEVEDVTSASISHGKMGIDFTYGKHPLGYDVMAIHEPGGGGAVTVPYAVVGGEILIGMVKQNRPTAGGVISELPRGFLEPGETHLEGAVRETAEETGLDAIKSRFVLLGNELNPNSAFFNTAEPGEGVSIFGLEVQPDELEEFQKEDGSTAYRFREDIRAAATEEKGAAEKIIGSEFVTIAEAEVSKDLFTEAGVGLLARHLLGSRVLRVSSAAELVTSESAKPQIPADDPTAQHGANTPDVR